ncbi:hypothetical protein [Schaalia hyovaginalis]|uniref:phage tail protein n=1 Tax=Schaalia hyovaginalis TaxID=29316 RepID=UPI002A82F242|nr:hypothetical protein [Schaalia hyovaginalis]MDY4491906.1 hypothetical protein [Schaalia hyovaginalis]
MAGHVVKVSVVANTKQFSRAFKGLANETGLSSLASAGKAAIGVFAKVATATTAAVGAAAVKAVGMAADLEQSTGAVEAVFKQAADQMKAYAAEAPTAVGLTANAYQELATVLGSQLKNGGTAIDELGGKTNELIGLGADLSAMFGGTTADAVGALSSALKGERDPIERYGVTLKQAMIDAKASELGFADVSSSSAQQAATLALIMEQTADAQGAFAREGDTLAHQIQVLKARITDLATQAGENLLPLATSAVTFINDNLGPAIDAVSAFVTTKVIPALQAAAGIFQTSIAPKLRAAAEVFTSEILPRLQALAGWISQNAPPIFDGFTRLIQDWGPALTSAGGVIAAFVAGFQAFQKVTAIVNAVKVAWAALSAVLAANPIILIAAAIAALAAGFVYAYQHSETFRNIVNAGLERIKTAALGLWDALQTAWQTIGVPIATLIVNVFQGVAANWDAIWNGIVTTLTGVWTAIQGIVSGALTVIQGIIQVITSAISGDWSGVWEGIKNILSGAWTAISSLISGYLGIVQGIIQSALATISGIWSGLWNMIGSTVTSAWNGIISGIRSGLSAAVSTIATLPGRILSALAGLGSLLTGAGRSVIDGFVNGIMSAFGRVRDTLASLTSLLPDWKGPAPVDKVILRDSGRLIIDGLVTGLESRYSRVRQTLHGLTGMIADTQLPPLSMPGARTGASGVHVTINVTGGLASGPEIGREVERALNQWWAVSGKRGLIL